MVRPIGTANKLATWKKQNRKTPNSQIVLSLHGTKGSFTYTIQKFRYSDIFPSHEPYEHPCLL